MMILDLPAAIDRFIESGAEPFGPRYRDMDELVIRAINSPSMAAQERIKTVRNWWARYSVSRNLREGEHDRVARAVLSYADQRQTRELAKERVVTEFLALQNCMKSARDQENQSRVIDSLCSKTLWFCYPYSVPMLDGNAEGAIRVISRLCDFPVHQDESPVRKESLRYANFATAWFEGYRLVSPKIRIDDEHPYAVRVFDGFLWWLGQGNFEAAVD